MFIFPNAAMGRDSFSAVRADFFHGEHEALRLFSAGMLETIEAQHGPWNQITNGLRRIAEVKAALEGEEARLIALRDKLTPLVTAEWAEAETARVHAERAQEAETQAAEHAAIVEKLIAEDAAAQEAKAEAQRTARLTRQASEIGFRAEMERARAMTQAERARMAKAREEATLAAIRDRQLKKVLGA